MGGAMGGAVVSGVIMGDSINSALNPGYWPYEESRKSLELDCDGTPAGIVFDTNGATLSQNGKKTLFFREQPADKEQRLLYYAVRPVDQGEEDLIVDETAEQPHTLDWLEVMDEKRVHLTMSDSLVICRKRGDARAADLARDSGA